MPIFGRKWQGRLMGFVAVLGPGLIAGAGGNDAGGIWTYSSAGAQFGYGLLWPMIPTTIALIVVQEMAARMGAATGKGLSDLIREEFGLRVTVLLMLALVATNFGNIIAEFAGVATSLELFGVSRHIVVPLAGMFVWALVVRGTYNTVEKVFLGSALFFVCYVLAGILAGPDWRAALLATVTGPREAVPASSGSGNFYVYAVVGLVGTTIAPWMQFYLQASVVEKGVTMRQYRALRWDVIIGSLLAAVIAWFIIVACAAALHTTGRTHIRDAADAAQALLPLAGEYAYLLFAAGLFNASLFAATVLPISTSYAVCEGLGMESGLDKKFHEAPAFYWLYTLLIVAGAGVLLMPRFPLGQMMLFSQVVNGIMLPFVLVFMLLLSNDRELMGDHVNSRAHNAIAWLTVVVMILLTIALLVMR